MKNYINIKLNEYDSKSFWYKLFNKRKPIYLGNSNHKLSLDKYKNVQIDDQSCPMDTVLMYWLISHSENNIDWEEIDITIRPKIYSLFLNIVQHIEENYLKYTQSTKIGFDKLASLYLTSLSGMYMIQKDSPAFNDENHKFFKFDRTNHIQIYHIFEQIVNNRTNSNHDYTVKQYTNIENDKSSQIIFDSALSIVRSLNNSKGYKK